MLLFYLWSQFSVNVLWLALNLKQNWFKKNCFNLNKLIRTFSVVDLYAISIINCQPPIVFFFFSSMHQKCNVAPSIIEAHAFNIVSFKNKYKIMAKMFCIVMQINIFEFSRVYRNLSFWKQRVIRKNSNGVLWNQYEFNFTKQTC